MDWYYSADGVSQQGPVSTAEIILLLARQQWGPHAKVWCEGWPQWVPPKNLRVVGTTIERVAPASPPPAVIPPPPPRPVSRVSPASQARVKKKRRPKKTRPRQPDYGTINFHARLAGLVRNVAVIWMVSFVISFLVQFVINSEMIMRPANRSLRTIYCIWIVLALVVGILPFVQMQRYAKSLDLYAEQPSQVSLWYSFLREQEFWCVLLGGLLITIIAWTCSLTIIFTSS